MRNVVSFKQKYRSGPPPELIPWDYAPTVAVPERNDDPVFAVIAEHRAAVTDVLAVGKVHGKQADYTAEWWATKPAEDAAWDRWNAALMGLIRARPTTLEGVAALLAHLGQDEWLGLNGRQEEEVEMRNTVLTDAALGGTAEERLAVLDFPNHLARVIRGLMRPI